MNSSILYICKRICGSMYAMQLCFKIVMKHSMHHKFEN